MMALQAAQQGGRRIVDGFYGVGGTMVDIAIFGEGKRGEKAT
jgi:hypothetical protein